ncbi:hypothetical protein OQA88_12789 [Cercophora sp. LCS_1]
MSNYLGSRKERDVLYSSIGERGHNIRLVKLGGIGRADLLQLLRISDRAYAWWNRCGESSGGGGDDGPIVDPNLPGYSRGGSGGGSPQPCTAGTGPWPYTALCQITYHYNYCPQPCECTQRGPSASRPTPTSPAEEPVVINANSISCDVLTTGKCPHPEDCEEIKQPTITRSANETNIALIERRILTVLETGRNASKAMLKDLFYTGNISHWPSLLTTGTAYQSPIANFFNHGRFYWILVDAYSYEQCKIPNRPAARWINSACYSLEGLGDRTPDMVDGSFDASHDMFSKPVDDDQVSNLEKYGVDLQELYLNSRMCQTRNNDFDGTVELDPDMATMSSKLPGCFYSLPVFHVRPQTMKYYNGREVWGGLQSTPCHVLSTGKAFPDYVKDMIVNGWYCRYKERLDRGYQLICPGHGMAPPVEWF